MKTVKRRSALITLTINGEEQGQVYDNYRYLWLKYVSGFNMNLHCARSLLGPYSEHLGRSARINREFEMDETEDFDFLYLCGVNFRGYQHNFHFPVVYKKGASCEKTDANGLVFVFRNARALKIPPLPSGFMDLTSQFTTCRNFQFGFEYYARHEIEALQAEETKKKSGRKPKK